MEISNADRLIFPDDDITKGQVCAYYALVADRLLPFIAGRALTVERYPKGIGEKGFMQKNAPSHFGDDLIDRISVPKEDRGVTVYPIVRSTEAIVAYANLGVITFHAPPVAIESNGRPDWVIWDLDPPEGRVDLVREAARSLRSVLAAFEIPTFLLASGSKGYHLRTRLDLTITLEESARIARGTAALAAGAHSDMLTLAFRKADRGDRVVVDWLRNAALSTSVAPWSLRPRTGAPIAVPLTWDELALVDPDGVGLRSVGDRLDLDLWSEMTPVDLDGVAAVVDAALDHAGIVLEPFDRFRS